MKIIVVAVRDQKADAFGHPWYAQSVGMAVRHFGDAVQSQDEANMWKKHPEDFALFRLGEFDQRSGEFKCAKPEQLCLATDFIKE